MRQPSLVSLAVAALALLLLVGSQPGAADRADQPSPEPHVVDPSGDARQWNSGYVQSQNERCWLAGEAAAGLCGGVVQQVPEGGGTPAAEALDLLSVTFTDTAEHLIVSMEVVALTEDLRGMATSDGKQGSTYAVCWTAAPEGSCDQQVVLSVSAHGTRPGAVAHYMHWGSGCTLSVSCGWRVDHELEPGRPGVIRWLIPRDVMPSAEAGDVLQRPQAWVSHRFEPEPFSFGYLLKGPGPDPEGYGWSTSEYRVDDASPGRAYVLRTGRSVPSPSDLPVAILTDPPKDVSRATGEAEAARPDLDILALQLIESPQALTLATRVAQVDVVPKDSLYYTVMGLPSGLVVKTFVTVEGTERHAESGACVQSENGTCARWAVIPVEVTAVPGTPGWINVTYARSDLGSPDSGALLSSLFSFLYDGKATGQDAASFSFSLTQYGNGDKTSLFPPYRLRYDTESALAREGEPLVALFEDEPGDVTAAPLLTDEEQTDPFDILFLEAQGRTPTASRLTLGLRDLSRVAVPPGYDAILYAAALETESGTVMAALFKGKSSQEFFCAQDTVVLSEEPRDPRETVWQPIEGSVAVAKEQPGASNSGAVGSIVFTIPHSCFGRDHPGVVPIKRVAAGTFLIQEHATLAPRLHEMDRLAGAQPILLGTASIRVPEDPWYAKPFGVENFWDMVGIAVAVSASATGLVVVQRKRGMLRRYLDAIDAVREEVGNPRGRELALLKLRSDLKADLQRGKVTEGHYVIIEKRLEHQLSSVRDESLAKAFGDLPHNLLQKLQNLAVDGQVSGEDERIFLVLLEEDTTLRDDAKEKIRRRLTLLRAEQRATRDATTEG